MKAAMKEALLVSACFLGRYCKYDGGSNPLPPELLQRLRARYRLIPVCPETAGQLPIPRAPSERRSGGVCSRDGADVTAAYERGAQTALALCRRFGCRKALLKERSPSCGSGLIYDGSFSHTLIPGDGWSAEKLRAQGIALYGESTAEHLLEP
jgi:uncharacterized protein YbbK (DUF523 family)